MLPNTFTAVQVVETMLRASARENQLLLSTEHIYNLLKALLYKLEYSGFTDSIIGWESFVNTDLDWPSASKEINASIPSSPAIIIVIVLVNGFHRLERISDYSGIIITAGRGCYCAWLITFTKWCLGAPPKVITADGIILLDEPCSSVLLIMTNNAKIKVELSYMLDGLSTLWSSPMSPTKPKYWTGIVSIKTFAERHFQQLDLNINNKQIYQVLLQAIPYSLKVIRQSL